MKKGPFKMKRITPLKQNTGESLHTRGGDSTLSSEELYKKHLKEGRVKVQRIGFNPFGILKKPINVYTRKKRKKR